MVAFLKYFIRFPTVEEVEQYVKNSIPFNEGEFIEYKKIVGHPSPFKFKDFQEYISGHKPLTEEDVNKYKETLSVFKIATTTETEEVDTLNYISTHPGARVL